MGKNEKKNKQTKKTCTFFKPARNKLYHDIAMKTVSISTKSSMVDYFPL